MSTYLSLAKARGATTWLDDHNVESDLLFKSAGSHYAKLLAWQAKRFEARQCREADFVSATSIPDLKKLKRISGREVILLPNTIDTKSYGNAEDTTVLHTPPVLFFSGTLDYQPNVEGLHWFVTEVLPKIKTKVIFRVAGGRPGDSLKDLLTKAQAELIPNPLEMEPHLKGADLVVVPLRSGSGTRLKILEAMAAGKPVISTPLGAEGLEVTPERDIAVASSAPEFASLVDTLLRDVALRKSIAQQAAKTVAEKYDWRCLRATRDLHILTT